jgi:hypothetical protein
MRLIRLSAAYPPFLKKFYSKRLELSEALSDQQHNVLLCESYGWKNVWTSRLILLGYEVLELVCNAQLKRWAGVGHDVMSGSMCQA